MFLSYSLVIFLIGLTTYVISPVARKREWDDDAKTLVFYAVGITVVLGAFATFCRSIHYTLS